MNYLNYLIKLILLVLHLIFIRMEQSHNYAMNLLVPLMGIGPLLVLFIFVDSEDDDDGPSLFEGGAI